jgi:hypothetical protein
VEHTSLCSHETVEHTFLTLQMIEERVRIHAVYTLKMNKSIRDTGRGRGEGGGG